MATEDLTSEKVWDTQGSDEGEVSEMTRDVMSHAYGPSSTWSNELKETPEPSNLSVTLRPYQRRALTWLLERERSEFQDESAHKEGVKQETLHPLFEAYPLPHPPRGHRKEGGGPWTDHPAQIIYVNPFSGQITPIFPAATRRDRGGILADEMGLGKTIETLALIHANPPPEDLTKREGRPEKKTKLLYRPPSKTTLIVCPMSLLSQWRDECISASAPNSLRVEVHYGGGRETTDFARQLTDPEIAPDILITTYGVLMSEFQEGSANHDHGVLPRGLFTVRYWRVVLDEAHTIKNPQVRTAKACFALQASRRWALTGTPIQNSPDDLYSLLRFIDHIPWSQPDFWKQNVTYPIQRRGVEAIQAVQKALKDVLLRRTKTSRGPDGERLLALPPKTINIVYVEFSSKERSLYNLLQKDSVARFQELLRLGLVMRNYATVLKLLVRLRQTCSHYLLLLKRYAGSTDPFTVERLSRAIAESIDGRRSVVGEPLIEPDHTSSYDVPIDAPIEEECPVCLDMVSDAMWLPCLHILCRPCMIRFFDQWEALGQEGECPVCRKGPVRPANVLDRPSSPKSSTAPTSIPKAAPESNPSIYLPSDDLNEDQQSTKVIMLLRDLEPILAEDYSVKIVVFTQFLAFIDILGRALDKTGHAWGKLDGRSSQIAREQVLISFRQPRTGPRILLVSLRAGGLGLNLTVASHVFLMDPWWNWSVEAQAVDRIHRLGQTKSVHVTRYIVRDSVEEQMLTMQRHKEALCSGSFGERQEGEEETERSRKRRREAERLEELKILFGTSTALKPPSGR
ncbi:SNF2 family N-terminal domain-containing protein [Piptocephalis cylindrospora]|uniref:SNF2 family N-terminal domain-containing protein n=1 Tax=Piptocephalis cylindrospora TaxID=1907219 RepID=A0A4P9Y0J5_9FUNG|nr:SNF2 family N-terminal domain-containing protein [Piptocephalis cylindrospora]|eukprot:RKP12247.1 SNF2 family N-terminal domain-containing protein [Piptocephalis cylindrospora]